MRDAAALRQAYPQRRPWARRLFHTLTEPPASITDPLVRQRARTLASLALVLGALFPVIAVVSAYVRPQPLGLAEWVAFFVSLSSCFGAYALTRTRFYVFAATTFVAAGLIGPWLAAISEHSPHRVVASMVFALAGVIYSSFFLGVRATVIASVVAVGLAATLPFVHPLPDGDVLIVPVFLMMVMSTFLVVGTRERVRQTDHIAAQWRQLRSVIEATPDGMAVMRHDSVIYANPALVSLFRCERESDVVGRRLEEFVELEGQDRGSSFVQLAASSSSSREISCMRRDGSHLIAEVAAVHLIEFEAEPATLLIVRDVTEERLLQDQLLISERMASLGVVAAGIGHEINNPLVYVSTNIDLVLESLTSRESRPPSTSETMIELLRDAKLGAERVGQIVRTLKSFTRVDDERKDRIDVHSVIEASLGIARQEINQRATLVKDYGTVPLVLANETRLGQVVINLLVNAAQAIAEDTTMNNEVRVATMTSADGWCVISIGDTGCGIPKRHLGKIFDPFFTTKEIGTGTGLGLSVCLKIMRSLGGRIEVDSVEGEGTVFRVLLPPAPAEG